MTYHETYPFDFKTAVDLCSGRPVDAETVRKFASNARKVYDDRNVFIGLVNTLQHTIDAREAEIAILKELLLEYERTTIVHTISNV